MTDCCVLNNNIVTINSHTKSVSRKVSVRLVFLFYVGLFFIPFDNLIFAPSNGWATISPILFFGFVLINIDKVRLSFKTETVFFFLSLLLLSTINYVFYPFDVGALADTVSTLLLGVSVYLSVSIMIRGKKFNKRRVINIVFIAYLISFVYGVISMLGISSIDSFMASLEKRHYDRLSYTFTEPSFISMHLYGVLLPIIFIFRKNRHVYKLVFLLLAFIAFTFIFGKSSRFILDTIVVLVFYFIRKINFKRILTYVILALLILFGVLFIRYVGPLILGERLQRIYEYGIYADASLASRWFRINASLNGYLQKPLNFFFGFGVSNTDYPFKLGYNIAFLEYKNPYLDEVLAMENTINTQLFCMPIRIISDIGLLGFAFIVIKTFKKRYLFLYLVMFYLYLQFDSFSFYTFWIYLAFLNFRKAFKKPKVKKGTTGHISQMA